MVIIVGIGSAYAALSIAPDFVELIVNNSKDDFSLGSALNLGFSTMGYDFRVELSGIV